MNPDSAISYLDAERLQRSLKAGISNVFERREYLNRINVFPVPDGDTGTNMAFTFKTVLEAIHEEPEQRLDRLLARVAEAALDGARGNSGAIMAQYFHGCAQACTGRRVLSARALADTCKSGAKAAWTAMSEPVPGTLPTVLEDFADALAVSAENGTQDIRRLFRDGLERARESLANTPNQLAALKQAGVVDAGGQGFVDLLDGIWQYIETGEMATEVVDAVVENAAASHDYDPGQHRYCTECVIEHRANGPELDREEIMAQLGSMDCSSLVVAGGGKRVRVHVHVNNPAEIFLACEAYGDIRQQKADDMKQQHGLLDLPGEVAVVCDSGGDLPELEAERLGIHRVPVRVSFGDQDFMDGVSITPDEFYRMLDEHEEAPKTSQPPPQDFSRVYSMLCGHGYDVVSVGISSALSGTTDAARKAASQLEDASVRVVDSLSASSGQGLLAMMAAEAAQDGMSADEIEALLGEWIAATRVFAFCSDLSAAVKGGRVPAWFKKIADTLRLNPVLTASPKGEMSMGGVLWGRGADPERVARRILKEMQDHKVYRLLISHGDNEAGAAEVKRRILSGHGRIHSCHVTAAGPALGAHLGRGGLVVGLSPQPAVLGADLR